VRRAGQQLAVEVTIDDELYARMAGDGVVVATALGSSAYSMAAGGPLLSPTLHAAVCTPLAMHGGTAAPLVVPGGSDIQVRVQPGHGGFEVYVDGHVIPLDAVEYAVSVHEDKVSLVTFGDLGLGLSGLRERGLIADSPRVLARDARHV
jgi:NAD+ kinase